MVMSMLFDEIVQLAKEHGWKQQRCGTTGISGCFGTNFYKDGKVLTVSITEEGDMIYPDEDELKEMFEGLQNDKINPGHS
jgi:hypothetical protein